MHSSVLARCWLIGLLFAAGCSAVRPESPIPDELFGHRYNEETPDQREIMVITPPDSAATYFYYPVPVDTVHIRPAPFAPEMPVDAQQVRVEVLLKGSLPDACAELHAVEQEPVGNIIDVAIRMRRMQGRVCAMVLRPYRFYFMLDGVYGSGHYTLKINGKPYAFEIRAQV